MLIGKKLSVVLSLFVLLLLAAAGCSYFKSAVISEMVPGANPTRDKLECWLTIEFKKLPSGINPRDVKVRFTSIALDEPAEFDWDYIASHDVIAQGMMKGYKDNPDSQPGSDPPLGIPLKVNYPFKAKEVIELKQGEVIKLKAELYWGGKLVDSDETTIEHVYGRKSKEGK